MVTTTVVGGDSTTFVLPSGEISAASQALNQLLAGLPNSRIDPTTTFSPAPPMVTDVYELSGGGTDNLPAGHYGAIITDDLATTVNASGSGIMIIGNDANNSISISGTGTLYPGNGSELVGSGTVVVGDGNDTITVKGDASITAGNGNNSITVQLGNGSISVGSGNDTITLGGPNDTVTAAGAATVVGPGSLSATIGSGGGQLVYQGGAGGESVTAGSGNVTLAGGSNVTFMGGTGNTLMQATAGSGNDTFVGGAGADTMAGGGGGTGNLFVFDTGPAPEGGTHVIDNFVQGQDQIQLGSSYNVTNILANNVTYSGGGATISLDSGQTIITLNNTNITKLTTSDFKS